MPTGGSGAGGNNHCTVIVVRSHASLLQRAGFNTALLAANDNSNPFDVVAGHLKQLAEEQYLNTFGSPLGTANRFEDLVEVQVGDVAQARKCFGDLANRVVGHLPQQERDSILNDIVEQAQSAFATANEDEWKHGSLNNANARGVYLFTKVPGDDGTGQGLLLAYYLGALVA